MRTFGFVIIFFPVNYQDGSGDALRSHLRLPSFRRMPASRTFTALRLGNARANGLRTTAGAKIRQKRGNAIRKKFWMYTRVDRPVSTTENRGEQ
jgi:hypothetical protein